MEILYRTGKAAQLAGIHPGTLRLYCAAGLVIPRLDSCGTRLFTAAQIEEIRVVYQRNIAYRAAHCGRGRKSAVVEAS